MSCPAPVGDSVKSPKTLQELLVLICLLLDVEKGSIGIEDVKLLPFLRKQIGYIHYKSMDMCHEISDLFERCKENPDYSPDLHTYMQSMVGYLFKIVTFEESTDGKYITLRIFTCTTEFVKMHRIDSDDPDSVYRPAYKSSVYEGEKKHRVLCTPPNNKIGAPIESVVELKVDTLSFDNLVQKFVSQFAREDLSDADASEIVKSIIGEHAPFHEYIENIFKHMVESINELFDTGEQTEDDLITMLIRESNKEFKEYSDEIEVLNKKQLEEFERCYAIVREVCRIERLKNDRELFKMQYQITLVYLCGTASHLKENHDKYIGEIVEMFKAAKGVMADVDDSALLYLNKEVNKQSCTCT